MTTFADVLGHLASHPHVRMVSPDGRISFHEGPHVFTGLADGLMWFVDATGRSHHLPIDCGMTGAESGIRVRPDGFELTKFDVTIVVTFWVARDGRL